MALVLNVAITGTERNDLELALEEVLRLVREDMTSGFNKNDSGAFHFELVGEE